MFWKSENRHVNNLSCLPARHDTSFKYKFKSLPKPYPLLWYWLMTKGFQESTIRRPRYLMEEWDISAFPKTAYSTLRPDSSCFGSMEAGQRGHYPSVGGICRGASAALTPMALWFWPIRAGILKRRPELNIWLRLFASYRVIKTCATEGSCYPCKWQL